MKDVIAGRYALGEEIGRGGMARVVAAHDLRLDREVAIKLLPVDPVDDADPVGRARFVREARSSARFSHPHAVAVFDAGEADDLLYLVMELVDGPSLAALLAERGPLEVGESQRITDQVLQALGAAHRAGIVHRDVKPGNVLLTSSGDAKLADFGIAKRSDDLSADLTSTGQFVGTPKYLSPEQVVGEPVTATSDLYSTGVVLFEMLAGEPPFDAATPVATAIAHRDTPVPDLRSHRPDVPSHVAAVVRRALAKAPSDRFATADEMRAALVGVAKSPAVPPLLAPTERAPVVRPAVAAPVSPSPREVTLVMPAGAASGARHVWWLAVLAAVVVAGVAVAAIGRDGSSADPIQPDPSATVPAEISVSTVAPTSTPTTTPPTTAPQTTVVPTTLPQPAPPATLDELILLLEADPDAFGERGPQLHEDLLDILATTDDDDARTSSRDAERLRERLTEWAAEGEIDPDVAAIADALLGPLADQRGDDDDDDDD